MSTAMLDAALSYAERGWQVFPVYAPAGDGCSCNRPICKDVGKHPRTPNGLSDATTNAATIREWWTRWPDANIGVLTGPESGLLVIDLDTKGNMRGEDNFAALAAPGKPISTLTALTGRGKHLFFTHPGVAIRNSVEKLAPGVDVRADRGYVVAAPSLHASGARYTWEKKDQSVAKLPEWLMERLVLRTERDTRNSSGMSPADVSSAPAIYEGQRNDKLYKLGCALRGQLALSDDDVAERLLMLNQCSCVPPLEEDEVLRVAASVCQFPPESGPGKSQRRVERNPLYWFKFNVRDFYADQTVQMMSDYQLGWSTRLRASAWQNGGLLPADIDNLWRLAGARSKRAFQLECELVLEDYERVNIAGRARFLNRAMAAEYIETLDKWMKERAAGEANRERLRAEGRLRAVPESGTGGALRKLAALVA